MHTNSRISHGGPHLLIAQLTQPLGASYAQKEFHWHPRLNAADIPSGHGAMFLPLLSILTQLEESCQAMHACPQSSEPLLMAASVSDILLGDLHRAECLVCHAALADWRYF